MYEYRWYRDSTNANRFKTFIVKYQESDLLIGVSPEKYKAEMHNFAMDELILLRKALESYIAFNPLFGTSHSPLKVMNSKDETLCLMHECSIIAGVGPMAAVAGAFAMQVAGKLIEKFNLQNSELFVENGGDIFLLIQAPFLMGIHAGSSPLSDKIGLWLLPEFSPIGICTSSGTIGHSFSYGKADAVVVVCKSTAMADALATSIANRINIKEDLHYAISDARQYKEILATIMIKEDLLAVNSCFKLKLLKSKGE